MLEDSDDTIVVNTRNTSIKRIVPGEINTNLASPQEPYKPHKESATMKPPRKKTELKTLEFVDGDEALKFFPPDLKLTMLRECQRNGTKTPTCAKPFRVAGGIYTTNGHQSLFRAVKTDEQLLAARFKYGFTHQIIVVQEKQGKTIRDGRPVIVVGTQGLIGVSRTNGTHWLGTKYVVWVADITNSQVQELRADAPVEKLYKSARISGSIPTQNAAPEVQTTSLTTNEPNHISHRKEEKSPKEIVSSNVQNDDRDSFEFTQETTDDIGETQNSEEAEESEVEDDEPVKQPSKRRRAQYSTDQDYDAGDQSISSSSDSDTPLISRRDISSPVTQSPVVTSRGRRVKPRIDRIYGEALIADQEYSDDLTKPTTRSDKIMSQKKTSSHLVKMLDVQPLNQEADRPPRAYMTPDQENINPFIAAPQAALPSASVPSTSTSYLWTASSFQPQRPSFLPMPLTPSYSLPSTAVHNEPQLEFVFKLHQNAQAVRTRSVASVKGVEMLFTHARVAAKMGGWTEADILILQAEIDHQVQRAMVVRGDHEDFDCLMDAINKAQTKPSEILVMPDCD